MEPVFTDSAFARALGLSLPLIELQHVNEEFDVWAIGSDRIAKVPRTPTDEAKVATEIALYPLITDALGSRVPRILDAVEQDGRSILVYERAVGTQGQTIDGHTIEPDPTLASSLGEVLGSLHQIDEATAHEAGAGDRTVTLQPPGLGSRTLELVRQLVGDAVESFLDADPAEPFSRRTLCHTDIKGEHVFVDRTASSVTSVIDWADAEVCDPAKDYAGLVIWLGPTFAREAAAASGEEDGTLVDRAIWLGRAGLLAYWDDVLSARGHGPLPLITRQLLAAFSD